MNETNKISPEKKAFYRGLITGQIIVLAVVLIISGIELKKN